MEVHLEPIIGSKFLRKMLNNDWCREFPLEKPVQP